jgi:hypothetical protein
MSELLNGWVGVIQNKSCSKIDVEIDIQYA